MPRLLTLIALLMIAVGAIWVFQGLGYIGGSFMTGDRHWSWIGSFTALAGVVLLVLRARRRS